MHDKFPNLQKFQENMQNGSKYKISMTEKIVSEMNEDSVHNTTRNKGNSKKQLK